MSSAARLAVPIHAIFSFSSGLLVGRELPGAANSEEASRPAETELVVCRNERRLEELLLVIGTLSARSERDKEVVKGAGGAPVSHRKGGEYHGAEVTTAAYAARKAKKIVRNQENNQQKQESEIS